MSLCIAKVADNGHLIIAGDSKVSSYTASGVAFDTGERCEKIRKLPDGSVVFMSGFMAPLEATLVDYVREGMCGIGHLACILQRHTEKIPQTARENRESPLETAMLNVTYRDGLKMWLICNQLIDSNGYYMPYPVSLGSTVCIGSQDDTLLDYFKSILQGNSVEENVSAICRTYWKAENEQIGGEITIYEISDHGIENIWKISGHAPKSPDLFTPNLCNLHCELMGINVKNDAGETVISIDQDGVRFGNFNPTQVKYSSSGTTTPATAPPLWYDTYSESRPYASYSYDTGATWNAPIKIKGEDGKNGSDASVTYANIKTALQKAASVQASFITADEMGAPNIYGGNIYGSEIVGGAITTDTTIDVRTDAKIGEKLIIRGDNFGNGVEFHHDNGTKIAEVYVDPATETLFIGSASKNVVINGHLYSPYAVFAP